MQKRNSLIEKAENYILNVVAIICESIRIL